MGSERRPPHVLLIAQNDFLRAGNQSILNTVWGYVDAGFDVVMLCSRPRNDAAFLSCDELPSGVRGRVHLRFFNPAFRSLAWVARTAWSLLMRRQATRDVVVRCGDYSPTSPKAGFGGAGFISTLSEGLTLLSFLGGGIGPAVRLAVRYRPQVIYGYEIYGASLAWLVRRLAANAVLVTRFQGTVLYPYLVEERKALWRFPAHALALKYAQPDLLVMADDGTRGDVVCRKIRRDMSCVRFWTNGVSEDIQPIPSLDRTSWRRSNGYTAEAFVLLVTSRLVGWKRVDRAILLVAELQKYAPSLDWELIIIGDGECLDGLRSLAVRLGVAERVRFTGAMLHYVVNEYLNACDCLLSLNDHSNLGNPVLEALRVGKVVCSLNDGSTRGILEHGVNCVLVALDDFPKGMCEELLRLATDATWREKLQRNALDRGRKVTRNWRERMGEEVKEVRAQMARANIQMATNRHLRNH